MGCHHHAANSWLEASSISEQATTVVCITLGHKHVTSAVNGLVGYNEQYIPATHSHMDTEVLPMGDVSRAPQGRHTADLPPGE